MNQKEKMVSLSILAAMLALPISSLVSAQMDMTEGSNRNFKVTCAELETFFNILDNQIDWANGPTDQENKVAQGVELNLVEDLQCEGYFAGADFEMWEYDN